MKTFILIAIFLLFLCPGASAQQENLDIGYPVVDQMEAKLLGSIYYQEDIYKRLDRLEMRVFGQVTDAPLSDRVEKLDAATSQKPTTQLQSANPDYSMIIYDLEKNLLGSVYINEPINTRISRLENHVFKATSANYPTEERLQRLCAYHDAQESNDYYSNQSQMKQYYTVSNGVKVLSLLFMVLQAFLL